MRFEAPDSRNRWDSPLFIIHPDEELPYQQITDALFNRKPPPPNHSTLPVCFYMLLSIILLYQYVVICYY